MTLLKLILAERSGLALAGIAESDIDELSITAQVKMMIPLIGFSNFYLDGKELKTKQKDVVLLPGQELRCRFASALNASVAKTRKVDNGGIFSEQEETTVRG